MVLVASVLVGLRNSVAQLFRELGTDNIFAFHRNGDPYTPASDRDALRRPLLPAFAETIARLGPSVRDVGVQLLVPAVTATRTITARAGGNESDAVLIEGVSPNFFDVTGAEFAAGRPFSEVENRVVAPVAVLGANVADGALRPGDAVGQPFLLGGERYFVVGVLAPAQGHVLRREPQRQRRVAAGRHRRPALSRGREHRALRAREGRAARPGAARSRDHPAPAAAACATTRRATSPSRRPTRSSRSSTGSARRSSWPRWRWRR